MILILWISEARLLRMVLVRNSLKVYLSSVLSDYQPSRDTGTASLYLWKSTVSA